MIDSVSVSAAHAAQCAAAEGRFQAFYDATFDRDRGLGTPAWGRLAAQAGIVDVEGFEQCVTQKVGDDAVHRDTVAGNQLGILGVPVFLINERKITGFHGERAMDSLIAMAFEDPRELGDDGPAGF